MSKKRKKKFHWYALLNNETWKSLGRHKSDEGAWKEVEKEELFDDVMQVFNEHTLSLLLHRTLMLSMFEVKFRPPPVVCIESEEDEFEEASKVVRHFFKIKHAETGLDFLEELAGYDSTMERLEILGIFGAKIRRPYRHLGIDAVVDMAIDLLNPGGA